MKRLILNLVTVLAMLLSPALLFAGNSYACGGGSTPKGQVLQGVSETGSDCSGNGVFTAISAGVSVLSIVAGIAAVLMIILAGFKYITSNGDTNKVANAKTTLIYALIGVAVAALAQFLVHFVLNRTGNISG